MNYLLIYYEIVNTFIWNFDTQPYVCVQYVRNANISDLHRNRNVLIIWHATETYVVIL